MVTNSCEHNQIASLTPHFLYGSNYVNSNDKFQKRESYNVMDTINPFYFMGTVCRLIILLTECCWRTQFNVKIMGLSDASLFCSLLLLANSIQLLKSTEHFGELASAAISSCARTTHKVYHITQGPSVDVILLTKLSD